MATHKGAFYYTKEEVDELLSFQPGDTFAMNDTALPGRQRAVSGSDKYISTSIVLPKKAYGRTVTFSPAGYFFEAFGGGGAGTIISTTDTSKVSFTLRVNANAPYTVIIDAYLPSGTAMQHNNCCTVFMRGTLNFS